MKARFFIITLLLALPGCAREPWGPDTDPNIVACQSTYGFTPGTQDFDQCIQRFKEIDFAKQIGLSCEMASRPCPLWVRIGQTQCTAHVSIGSKVDMRGDKRMSAYAPKADISSYTYQIVRPSRLTREGYHSAHRKLQQLDRVIVLHAAAYPLGRVEQHVGFRRVGIPQHRDAGTIHHEVAAVEIASPRFDRITNGCRLSLCG